MTAWHQHTVTEHALQDQLLEEQANNTLMNPSRPDPSVELTAIEQELATLEAKRVALSKEIDQVGFRHSQFGERRTGEERRNGPDRREKEGRRGDPGRRDVRKDRRLARSTRLSALSAEMTQLSESIEMLNRRRQNLLQMLEQP